MLLLVEAGAAHIAYEQFTCRVSAATRSVCLFKCVHVYVFVYVVKQSSLCSLKRIPQPDKKI